MTKQTEIHAPIKAFFSKSDEARAAQIVAIRAAAAGSVIHLHPKNSSFAPVAGVSSFTYEEIDEGTVWLAINAKAGSNSTLIMEKPSRYPRVASQKFKRMQTLASRCAEVFVVDIVPFTLEPRFLYTTFSYVGTEVLGVAKYSAMHEEYEELTEDGRIVQVGKDPAEMARKIAPVSTIDYDRFTVPREIIPVETTFAELESYATKKEELFANEDDAAKIVTRLADHAHAFPSRADALLRLLRRIDEGAVIYVNLTSYATRINRALKAAGMTRHKAVSYQIGCVEPTEVAVYMEAPIVNSYYFLDAEARIVPDGRAYHIASDAKVDVYLFGKLQAELDAIDALTSEMAK